MTPKELIEQIKDYADCADASYAMLEYTEAKIREILEKGVWEKQQKQIRITMNTFLAISSMMGIYPHNN